MTSKQIYEAVAIELSNGQAPTLKLYEYNYFINQAIRQFVNKVYNVYDINQQTTDDLRVLKSTATLIPQPFERTGNTAIDYIRGATYYVDMPDDYLHLLNCVCLFNVNKKKDCWNAGDVMVVGAAKLTADAWSNIVDDIYNQPSKKRPYYYIHNQNKVDDNNGQGNRELPTNNDTDKLHTFDYSLWKSVLDAAHMASTQTGATKESVINAASTAASDNTSIKDIITGILNNANVTDASGVYKILLDHDPIASGNTFNRTFNFDSNGDGTEETYSTIEKPAGSRHANTSKVRVEIRCGRDTSNVFELSAVQIDYIKAPQYVRLTQEQLDSDEDISQVMEFPDYVAQEIINELVNLIMRKTNDPSLQTHLQMTQSIARPTGQQQQ